MTPGPQLNHSTEGGVTAFWRDFWRRQPDLLDTGLGAAAGEVADWLTAQFPSLETWRVLDVGAGTGGLAGELSRHAGRVVALDVVPATLASARLRFGAGLAYLVGSGLTLPLRDRSVELVYSLGLLEHFAPPDQVRLLRECARVCRQAVLIGVPNRECLFYRLGRFYLERQDRWEFADEVAMGSLEDLFAAAGLEIITETSLLHGWALDYLARLPGAGRVVEIAREWLASEPQPPFEGYLRVALGQPAPRLPIADCRLPIADCPESEIREIANRKSEIANPINRKSQIANRKSQIANRKSVILLACATHYDLRTVGCLIREYGHREDVVTLGATNMPGQEAFWARFGRPFDRPYEAPTPGTYAGFREALREAVADLGEELAVVVTCAPSFGEYPAEILDTDLPLLVLQPNKEYTVPLQTEKAYCRTVPGPRWLSFYRDEDPHCHNVVTGFHFADYMSRQPKQDWRAEMGFDPSRPLLAILPFPSPFYQLYVDALGLRLDSGLAWTEYLQDHLHPWLDEGFQFLVRLHPHFAAPEWEGFPTADGLRIVHGGREWEEEFDFCDGVALVNSSAIYYPLLLNATGLYPPKPILDLVMEEPLNWNVNAFAVRHGLATAWRPGQSLRAVWARALAEFPPREAYRQAAYPLIYHPDGRGVARVWRLIERLRAGEEIPHYA